MRDDADRIEGHVGRWWLSFGVALFLLVPFDLFTTLLAVGKYGMMVETNPIMRWLLQQGLFAVATVNVVITWVTVIMFHVAIGHIRRAPPSYHRSLTKVVNVWVGILLVGGVVLVTNNLLVLV
ncbi:MAG: DUF5658 family protein [Haloferacaceae archaeon]